MCLADEVWEEHRASTLPFFVTNKKRTGSHFSEELAFLSLKKRARGEPFH
jgi:hypothetical protein